MVAKSLMSLKRSSTDELPLLGKLCLFGLAGLAFSLASGAGTSEAATHAGSSQHGTIAEEAKPTTPPPAAARYETDSYLVTILPLGEGYTAGKEGQVEINIVPKEKFHINAQFPYKFKTVDPPPENVAYPKAVLARADGNFNEKRGNFKLAFVPKKAGKVTIAGKLSFSVCSDANCVMDKLDLALDVDVR